MMALWPPVECTAHIHVLENTEEARIEEERGKGKLELCPMHHLQTF